MEIAEVKNRIAATEATINTVLRDLVEQTGCKVLAVQTVPSASTAKTSALADIVKPGPVIAFAAVPCVRLVVEIAGE